MSDRIRSWITRVRHFFEHQFGDEVDHHQVNGNVPGVVPRLFSLNNNNQRKRPLERQIPIEAELQLTDDEDEIAEVRFAKNRGWANPEEPLSKRMKKTEAFQERRRTRASVSGASHGKTKNDVTAKAPSNDDEPIIVYEKYRETLVPSNAGSSQPQASGSGSDKTDLMKFQFSPIRGSQQTKKASVIPGSQEEPSTSRASKSSYFKSVVPFSRTKKDEMPSKELLPQSRSIARPSRFMAALRGAGRGPLGDPMRSSFRLEERNTYANLVNKFNNIGNEFAGRHLQRSKVDCKALYSNWDKTNSPFVTVSFSSRRRSLVPSGESLTERVKQDLHLFSTPTASRSSAGSTPVGPTSPPVVIDLADDDTQKEEERQLVLYGKTPAHQSPNKTLLSPRYADLNEALSSTRYEKDDSPTSSKSLVPSDQDEDKDEDISILSESILNRPRRLNTLALENNSSKYVHKSWLNGVTESFRDNEKRREKEITEKMATVDVLNKESTLDKDLREDIRRKLTLTEIIVLEEPPPSLPEITSEMQMVIDVAKRPGREDDVLAKIFNIDFTRGDVKTLAPCKWLNDNVVNAYIELVVQRSKENTSLPKVYAFTTFFYPKLLKEGYSNPLKRWTRKVDIFSHDLILFPIHLGLHWCLAAADLRDKSIRYYDSLGGRNDKCLNALLNYLAQEMKERKGQMLRKEEWTLENVPDVPMQQNGSDCGVFTCKFAEYLSREVELTFSQENMDYYRARMIYEIIKNDLLYP